MSHSQHHLARQKSHLRVHYLKIKALAVNKERVAPRLLHLQWSHLSLKRASMTLLRMRSTCRIAMTTNCLASRITHRTTRATIIGNSNLVSLASPKSQKCSPRPVEPPGRTLSQRLGTVRQGVSLGPRVTRKRSRKRHLTMVDQSPSRAK